MFQSTSQNGMVTTTDAQRPCRTVRRTSRTANRLRPSSRAIIGAVAPVRPMPKIMKAK